MGNHLSAALIVIAALAYPAWFPEVSSAQASPPEGSYKQTCKDIRVEGDTLFATCEMFGGEEHRESNLAYKECVSQVNNLDGFLDCNVGPIPEGSYRRTCREKRYDTATKKLSAKCLSLNNVWVPNVDFDTGSCLYDPSNIDGKLRCNPQLEEITVHNQCPCACKDQKHLLALYNPSKADARGVTVEVGCVPTPIEGSVHPCGTQLDLDEIGKGQRKEVWCEYPLCGNTCNTGVRMFIKKYEVDSWQ